MMNDKLRNCGRAEIRVEDVKIESYVAATDEPAVRLLIPGATDAGMSPAGALLLGAKFMMAALLAANRVEREIEPTDLAVKAFIEAFGSCIPTNWTPENGANHNE